MASGKSLKDSITNIRGWHQRITLALDYGGQDVGYLFQRMKWAVEDMEQRFDKYFPPPNIDTEEGRKAEDQLNEFLETWGLSIEDMDTEEFLTSLMHLFNRDIEPKYQLKDLDSQHISPCGVWMMMEALAPIVDKGVPAEETPKEEPKSPELPPVRLVTCTGCGGKKQYGTNRLPLKRVRGIGRLRRQRQRKERRSGHAD